MTRSSYRNEKIRYLWMGAFEEPIQRFEPAKEIQNWLGGHQFIWNIQTSVVKEQRVVTGEIMRTEVWTKVHLVGKLM